MPKISFDDVVPPNKRSIRNIPIPSGGKRKTQEVKTAQGLSINRITNNPVAKSKTEDFSEGLNVNRNIESNKISDLKIPQSSNPYEYYYPKNNTSDDIANDLYKDKNPKKNRNKYIYGGIAALVMLAFILIMMTVFSSATINIVPRTQYLSVSMDIDAVSDPVSEGVRFEVVKISKSKTVSVPATGEEEAEIKASGRITIYNNFSSEPQRLINRTRFESPNGLIYRISESVVVPGKRTESGKSVPGSIEVEVFADEPGDKYNIEKVDFTIPGFKDDSARYSGFYARSITPMTGGFVGRRKTVLPSEKQLAVSNIEAELKNDLLKDVSAKIPDNLVFLDGLITYESRELPQSESASSVTVGKEIIASVVVLNKEDLSKVIIGEYMKNYPIWDDIPAKIDNFTGISASAEISELESTTSFDLNINGNVNIVANINRDLIKEKILGISRKQADFVMDEFPGILNMTASIRPVWKKSFPDNPQKIKVIVSLAE